MLLLETQQGFPVATQHKTIAYLEGAVGQGGAEDLATALHFEHVYVVAALQTAVVQRMARELGALRHQYLGEIALPGE